MHAAGLKSGKGGNYNVGKQNLDQNLGKSCDCTNWLTSEFKYMDRRADAPAMRRAMAADGAEVCMIEHGKGWPSPSLFFGNKFRERWPGTLATMLRDPWSRFKSAFLRLHQLSPELTVEVFASVAGDRSEHQTSCFNRPNYYVRFLNGEGHCSVKENYARAVMNRTHLELAKRVLATFDYVFVVESNRTALEFGKYVGAAGAMPHLSNSAYSTLSTSKTGHQKRHQNHSPPPVQHFMAEWYAQNALDYDLYLWALARRGLAAAYAPLVGPAGPAE